MRPILAIGALLAAGSTPWKPSRRPSPRRSGKCPVPASPRIRGSRPSSMSSRRRRPSRSAASRSAWDLLRAGRASAGGSSSEPRAEWRARRERGRRHRSGEDHVRGRRRRGGASGAEAPPSPPLGRSGRPPRGDPRGHGLRGGLAPDLREDPGLVPRGDRPVVLGEGPARVREAIAWSVFQGNRADAFLGSIDLPGRRAPPGSRPRCGRGLPPRDVARGRAGARRAPRLVEKPFGGSPSRSARWRPEGASAPASREGPCPFEGRGREAHRPRDRGPLREVARPQVPADPGATRIWADLPRPRSSRTACRHAPLPPGPGGARGRGPSRARSWLEAGLDLPDALWRPESLVLLGECLLAAGDRREAERLEDVDRGGARTRPPRRARANSSRGSGPVVSSPAVPASRPVKSSFSPGNPAPTGRPSMQQTRTSLPRRLILAFATCLVIGCMLALVEESRFGSPAALRFGASHRPYATRDILFSHEIHAHIECDACHFGTVGQTAGQPAGEASDGAAPEAQVVAAVLASRFGCHDGSRLRTTASPVTSSTAATGSPSSTMGSSPATTAAWPRRRTTSASSATSSASASPVMPRGARCPTLPASSDRRTGAWPPMTAVPAPRATRRPTARTATRSLRPIIRDLHARGRAPPGRSHPGPEPPHLPPVRGSLRPMPRLRVTAAVRGAVAGALVVASRGRARAGGGEGAAEPPRRRSSRRRPRRRRMRLRRRRSRRSSRRSGAIPASAASSTSRCGRTTW